MKNSGINLADIKNQWEFSLYLRNKENRSKRCVFISHKKEDEKAAIEVGRFLMQQVGLNIYLDILDCVLQEAVSLENDKKIVESIQKGISCSDALLCIVSDRTKLSWWVPYEIGIAEYSKLYIGSIKLSKITDFPSFLKTQKTIDSISSFLDFISNVHNYGPTFSKFIKNDLETLDYTTLNEYFW